MAPNVVPVGTVAFTSTLIIPNVNRLRSFDILEARVLFRGENCRRRQFSTRLIADSHTRARIVQKICLPGFLSLSFSARSSQRAKFPLWLVKSWTSCTPREKTEDPITLYIPDVSVPDENNTATPPDVPLVVLLHGRCMDGETVQRILRFNELVDDREFILALPEGARNRFWCSTCARLGGVLSTRYGCRSWAATPACCAATPFSLRPADPETWEPVDDVEHISQVINAVKTQYNVAEDKVYIVGWENGGFMAYRMACEKPDLLAGTRRRQWSRIRRRAIQLRRFQRFDQDSRERSGHPR